MSWNFQEKQIQDFPGGVGMLVIVIELTYLIVGLYQHLVILAESDQEHNGRHILKAVDPFTPLRPLPSDIYHSTTPTNTQKN